MSAGTPSDEQGAAIPPGRAPFEILPFRQVPGAAVLAVINTAFAANYGETWFNWKHTDNPQGSSLGWVAVGPEGVLGVRLFLRWNLQRGTRTIRAVRPVDTSTAPVAQRRGVFRELTRHALAAVEADPSVDLIFNTPNEKSRPGYARLGWTILPPVTHGIRPVLPGPVGSLSDDEGVLQAFDQYPAPAERLSTERNAAFMRWRYDPRSGIGYRRARLRESVAPNGIVYRVAARRGFRLLILEELAGSPAERRILVRSVARRERAAVLMVAAGQGALDLLPGVKFPRGGSILAVRPLRQLGFDPAQRGAWALTLGDLEGII